jgi:CcmD family protein
MKKLALILPLIFCFTSLFAQKTLAENADEVLRSSNKIYVVVTIIALIFIGLSIYLFSIDRRLKKIEKEK